MRILRVFLLILFTVNSSTYAREYSVRTDKSSFARDIKFRIFSGSLTKDIINLLEQSTDFRFDQYLEEKRIYIPRVKLQKDQLSMELEFLDPDIMAQSSPDIQNAIMGLRQLKSDYHKKRSLISSHEFKNHYIDRMWCKKTNAKCFNITMIDLAIKYSIPLSQTQRYIENNIELFLANPDAARKMAMNDLDIKLINLPWYERLFEDDSQEITQKDLENAFHFFCKNYVEFSVARTKYYNELDEFVMNIAKKTGIPYEEIAPRDQLTPDSILRVTGKLDYDLSFVQYVNTHGNLDLTPLYDYFETLDFNSFVK